METGSDRRQDRRQDGHPLTLHLTYHIDHVQCLVLVSFSVSSVFFVVVQFQLVVTTLCLASGYERLVL